MHKKKLYLYSHIQYFATDLINLNDFSSMLIHSNHSCNSSFDYRLRNTKSLTFNNLCSCIKKHIKFTTNYFIYIPYQLVYDLLIDMLINSIPLQHLDQLPHCPLIFARKHWFLFLLLLLLKSKPWVQVTKYSYLVSEGEMCRDRVKEKKSGINKEINLKLLIASWSKASYWSQNTATNKFYTF